MIKFYFVMRDFFIIDLIKRLNSFEMDQKKDGALFNGHFWQQYAK